VSRIFSSPTGLEIRGIHYLPIV